EPAGVHALERLSGAKVSSHAARHRERGEKRLPNQLVREHISRLALRLLRDYESGSLRFVHRVKHRVATDVGDSLEHLQIEACTDHRRGSQNLATLGAHSLQAPANDQTHAFRDLELSDLNVREPAPLIVEHSPFLSEMPEYLFDEEGIPLGLSEDRLHER